MPVPDFQTLMLPALKLLATRSPMTTVEVRSEFATQCSLTRANLAEFLPNGGQARFANRVAWHNRIYSFRVVLRRAVDEMLRRRWDSDR